MDLLLGTRSLDGVQTAGNRCVRIGGSPPPVPCSLKPRGSFAILGFMSSGSHALYMAVPLEAVRAVTFRAQHLAQRLDNWVNWTCEVTSEDEQMAVLMLTPSEDRRIGEITVLGYGERSANGILWQPLPGQATLPSDAHDAPDACNFCQSRRARRHLLLRQPSGDITSAGTECLLRARIAPRVAAHRLYSALTGDPRNVLARTVEKISREPRYDVTQVLAAAIHFGRTDGYVSKAQSRRAGVPSTADRIAHLLRSVETGNEMPREVSDNLLPAMVIQSQARLTGLGEGEFAGKVACVLTFDRVLERQFSLLAAAPHLYAQRDAPPPPDWESGWVGRIGERTSIVATVVRETTIREDVYGVRRKVVLRSEAGNCLVWFTSKDVSARLGDQLRVKATIKGHQTFLGVAETVVTRVNFTPL